MSALLRAARPSLFVSRRIPAAADDVYAAWIEPARIARWWAPGDARTLCASIDPRAGGSFVVMIETASGEPRIGGGVYREAKQSKKLVFTWAWRDAPERESLVTVLFRDSGADTMLTIIHEHLAEVALCDAYARDWDDALAQLAALFSTCPPPPFDATPFKRQT